MFNPLVEGLDWVGLRSFLVHSVHVHSNCTVYFSVSLWLFVPCEDIILAVANPTIKNG